MTDKPVIATCARVRFRSRRFCRRKRLGACLPPGSLHFIFAR